MTPKTTEAVRKALKAMIDASGHHPEDFCDPCVQKALIEARAAFTMLNTESKELATIKSAEEWANEIAPRKTDGSFDWVQFIERIQKDALACALNASPERVKETGKSVSHMSIPDEE